MATKSAVTFVRKSLGIRGKSEHLGRGYFVMEMAPHEKSFHNWDSVKKIFATKLRKWNESGIVERLTFGDFGVRVYFKEECGFGYYRGFRISIDLVEAGQLGEVFMVMEDKTA